MLDIYAPVEFIESNKVINGTVGFKQDSLRIRSYFNAAVNVMDAEMIQLKDGEKATKPII